MARMKADGSWLTVVEKNRAAHLGEMFSGKKQFSEQAIANISESLKGNARNKKQWTLICLNTGEELQVCNLSKWLRDHNFTAPTHYVKAGTENVYIIKEEHERFLAQKDARNAQRRLKRASA